MSDPTPGQLKRKSPPVVAEEKETPRAPKRIKLCLRAVVEALSKWRVDAKDLVFSDEGIQKRGGSADVAKAAASIVKSVGPGDQGSATTHNVAVKKVRLSGSDVNGRGQAAAFANELSLISELDHDNIVRLIGFVERAEEDIAWILLRWEDNGNIREFIHSQDWVIPERLELIYDVACGLEYLHSRDPPICHGDVKSLNILVSSHNRAIITDLGSARKLQAHSGRQTEDNVADTAPPGKPTLNQVQERGSSLVQIDECGTFLTLTGPVYTLRWAAPEVLRDEEFGLASDMWAFAWICWEIMTGSLPFNDLSKETDIVLSVARGDLPPITNNEHISQVRILCVMMTRCWGINPSTRPAAKDCESSIRFMDRITPTRRQVTEQERYSAEVLCALGYTKYENMQKKEAKGYFVRALLVACSDGDSLAAVDAMTGHGTVCRELNEYEEAEASYTEALKISRRLGVEQKVADAIWGLGEVYRLRNEYSKAEASFTEAQDIYARLGAEQDVANAIWGLGEVYRFRNEYSKAEASYSEARDICTRLGAERDAADAIWALGEVYRLQNQHSKAEASYKEAKEIYARLGAERKVADAIWGLGEIHRFRNEYSKAEASYTEARDIYARLGAEKDIADIIFGLGEIHRVRRKYSKAEASYTEAREIYARLGDEQKRAGAIWGLGEVYRQWRKKYSKAEASYIEAREIYARLGAEQDIADVTMGLGEVYRSRKEYPKAKAAFIEARELYTKTGYHGGVENALSSLGELSEEEDSLSEASAKAEGDSKA